MNHDDVLHQIDASIAVAQHAAQEIQSTCAHASVVEMGRLELNEGQTSVHTRCTACGLDIYERQDTERRPRPDLGGAHEFPTVTPADLRVIRHAASYIKNVQRLEEVRTAFSMPALEWAEQLLAFADRFDPFSLSES